MRAVAVALLVLLCFNPPAQARTSRLGSGAYLGGQGSSHRHGHYLNPTSGNHYRHNALVQPRAPGVSGLKLRR